MTTHNQEIRTLIKEKGISMAQVATELGMFDSNFIRMLRLPLKPEKKAIILAVIEKLTVEKELANELS